MKKKYKLVCFVWSEIPAFVENTELDFYKRLFDVFEVEYGMASICGYVLPQLSVLNQDELFKKSVLRQYSGRCVVVDETKYGLFLLEHSDKIHKVEVVEYEV